MNYKAATDYIANRLQSELADNLHYHGYHHTEDVMQAIDTITSAEGVNEEELIILNTAAMFHDAGFMEQYADNEEIACQIARQSLPGFYYPEDKIEQICQIIMATRMDIEPRNHLEEIMCDADHDYFGRKDYKRIAATLYKELAEYGYVYNEREWILKQINFLVNKHKFYTSFSMEERQPVKERHIQRLKERLSYL